MEHLSKLQKLCQLVRYDILTSTTAAGSGHATSSLSAVELMTTLFFAGFLRYDLEHPENLANDRFLLSKGHASPLLYSLYHAAGALTLDRLLTLRTFDSELEGHPTPRFKYVDFATGSLGQGLSIGVGMALGMRLSASRLLRGSVFKEGYIHQKNDNQNQTVRDTNFGVYINPIDHNDFSSNITANTKDNIPQNKLLINSKNFSVESAGKKLGSINTDPNQPADILVSQPESILNKDLEYLRIKDNSSIPLPKVFVLLGDSEMSEGQVWEAMQIASYYKLDNLIAVVDVNRLGQRGETMLGWDVETYAKRAKAFGWETIVVDDGHDLDQVFDAFNKITIGVASDESLREADFRYEGKSLTEEKSHERQNLSQFRPKMIIAKTVKGKGVSFLEDKNGWHGKALSKDQLQEALKELGEVDLNARGAIKKPLEMENGSWVKKPVWKSGKDDGEIHKSINTNLQISSPNQLPNPNPPSNYQLNTLIATREAYGKALVSLGQTDDRIVVLDAEVSNSTYAQMFAKKFPDRFFEMFIAEQNMISTALGLSKMGYIPFASSFAAFLTRAFDQIRMAQYSYHLGDGRMQDGRGPNLKFVGSHAGISIGSDGPSQMALEDLAMMRSILNSVVLYPSDAVSSFKLTQLMAKNDGIFYLRTTREKTPVIYQKDEEFKIGGSKVLHQSPNDAAVVFTAGITLHEALKAYEELKKEQISICVVDLYSIKPIDQLTIRQLTINNPNVIVVEDHYPYGGLGEAVSKTINNQQLAINNFSHLAVSKLPRSGSPEELLHFEQIDKDAIIKAVKTLIEL